MNRTKIVHLSEEYILEFHKIVKMRYDFFNDELLEGKFKRILLELLWEDMEYDEKSKISLSIDDIREDEDSLYFELVFTKHQAISPNQEEIRELDELCDKLAKRMSKIIYKSLLVATLAINAIDKQSAKRGA